MQLKKNLKKIGNFHFEEKLKKSAFGYVKINTMFIILDTQKDANKINLNNEIFIQMWW